MRKFNNLNELHKHVQKRVDEILATNVANEVVNVQQKNIQDVVYDAYNPTDYIRRSANGGLLDQNNIETKLIKPGTLSIRNVTPPNPLYDHDQIEGDYIDYAVEKGIDYNFRNPGARPFIKSTINDLKKNKQHLDAMKKGISNKRGI